MTMREIKTIIANVLAIVFLVLFFIAVSPLVIFFLIGWGFVELFNFIRNNATV